MSAARALYVSSSDAGAGAVLDARSPDDDANSDANARASIDANARASIAIHPRASIAIHAGASRGTYGEASGETTPDTSANADAHAGAVTRARRRGSGLALIAEPQQPYGGGPPRRPGVPTPRSPNLGRPSPRPPRAPSSGRRTRPQVGATLSPGRKGTKNLLARYGAQLVCVRYRYDAERNVRQTTVELVVSERPWRPLVSRCAPNEIVGIAIRGDEPELLARMCRVGAWWNPGTGQWRLRLDRALALGLADRVRRLRKPKR